MIQPRIALAGYVTSPDESGVDLLREAEGVFVPPPANPRKAVKKAVAASPKKPSVT